MIADGLIRHQQKPAAAMGATCATILCPSLAEERQELIGGATNIVFEGMGKRGLIDTAIGLVPVHGAVVGVGGGADVSDAFRTISKQVSIVKSVFFTMPECSAAIGAPWAEAASARNP